MCGPPLAVEAPAVVETPAVVLEKTEKVTPTTPWGCDCPECIVERALDPQVLVPPPVPPAVVPPRSPDEVLLVIDMQPRFHSSLKPETRLAVLAEVAEAKRKGVPIYAVEYRYPEDTSPRYDTNEEILRALEGYPYARRVPKTENDGSQPILDQLKEDGLWPHRARIVGVNTDACVKATAHGLADKLPDLKIEAVKEACNSNSWDVENGIDPWKTFQEYNSSFENVSIQSLLAAGAAAAGGV